MAALSKKERDREEFERRKTIWRMRTGGMYWPPSPKDNLERLHRIAKLYLGGTILAPDHELVLLPSVLWKEEKLSFSLPMGVPVYFLQRSRVRKYWVHIVNPSNLPISISTYYDKNSESTNMDIQMINLEPEYRSTKPPAEGVRSLDVLCKQLGELLSDEIYILIEVPNQAIFEVFDPTELVQIRNKEGSWVPLESLVSPNEL